jgi:hypothetical protein
MMRYAAGKCVPRARRLKVPYKLRHKMKPDAILCCLGKRRAHNHPLRRSMASTYRKWRRIAKDLPAARFDLLRRFHRLHSSLDHFSALIVSGSWPLPRDTLPTA